jgi:hypothetical protein
MDDDMLTFQMALNSTLKREATSNEPPVPNADKPLINKSLQIDLSLPVSVWDGTSKESSIAAACSSSIARLREEKEALMCWWL